MWRHLEKLIQQPEGWHRTFINFLGCWSQYLNIHKHDDEYRDEVKAKTADLLNALLAVPDEGAEETQKVQDRRKLIQELVAGLKLPVPDNLLGPTFYRSLDASPANY